MSRDVRWRDVSFYNITWSIATILPDFFSITNPLKILITVFIALGNAWNKNHHLGFPDPRPSILCSPGRLIILMHSAKVTPQTEHSKQLHVAHKGIYTESDPTSPAPPASSCLSTCQTLEIHTANSFLKHTLHAPLPPDFWWGCFTLWDNIVSTAYPL